jgi:hypothetical protein
MHKGVEMQNKLNRNTANKEAVCEKIELANSCGVRLIYCQDCNLGCNVVELEIGAISVRLCPEVIQRMANVMMKASLKLEHIAANNHAELPTNIQPQMIH